jgi:hypothetical protein
MPKLDAIILTAGVQYTQDWFNPESIDLESMLTFRLCPVMSLKSTSSRDAELATETELNYNAVLATAKGTLTHFKKMNRGAFITVTSGLAAVPKADTANYNATSTWQVSNPTPTLLIPTFRRGRCALVYSEPALLVQRFADFHSRDCSTVRAPILPGTQIAYSAF